MGQPQNHGLQSHILLILIQMVSGHKIQWILGILSHQTQMGIDSYSQASFYDRMN